MGNEFWAAIVGSIVGGLIAAFVQLLSIRHQASETKQRKLENDQVTGRGLVIKLMRLVSDLHGLNQHLEQSISRIEPGMQLEPWSFVLPIANLPDRVQITHEELALILVHDLHAFKDLLDLEPIHLSSLRIMQIYGDMRAKLLEGMQAAEFSGNVGAVDLDTAQLRIFRPKMIELNSLINALQARKKSDLELARKTILAVARILDEKYKLKMDLEFDF